MQCMVMKCSEFMVFELLMVEPAQRSKRFSCVRTGIIHELNLLPCMASTECSFEYPKEGKKEREGLEGKAL